MKHYFLILIALIPQLHFSQPNTDVFLFDLNTENETFQLSNIKNISNNQGYDNQPSFLDDNTILFASTRKGQTDIAKYSINYDSKIWINHTEGSEYSPLKIPNQNAVSAIRLDKDGKQVLYKYSLRNGESEVLVDDIIIGYHVWYNKDILASSVLEDDGLSLYITNFKEKENYKVEAKVGRSLHKIPNTKLVSYISKENDSLWKIKSINPISRIIKSIIKTLPNTEDMCWLPNGTILMGKDNVLYKFNPSKNVEWIEATSLKNYGITNITRLAVSPDGSKLALVGEGGKIEKNDPTKKLEPKLENIAWISGTWKGEAFGGITEEIWSKPSGGSMMATFKLINDGKVSFYEIEIIREVKSTLILQLKHFNNDLKGWETKDETVDFPLKEITATKVVFEGMTFEKISNNEMNVFVDMHNDDGTTKTLKFNYIKE
ncbi:MAG: hypothetical protein DRI75_09860 [Bacteroidetes bacterium]|nr:MAG: hypothetical protein DRI75_09860 [Bacteroidota bacterium]